MESQRSYTEYSPAWGKEYTTCCRLASTVMVIQQQQIVQSLCMIQSSLTEPLDFGYFSCLQVDVSLAVVTTNGSSEFTSPSSICVHRGAASAPRNLRATSVIDDPRPEFLGHAVITLEWDPPESEFQDHSLFFY